MGMKGNEGRGTKLLNEKNEVILLMDRDWQRLIFSLADRNDYLELELSEAWEPPNNS